MLHPFYPMRYVRQAFSCFDSFPYSIFQHFYEGRQNAFPIAAANNPRFRSMTVIQPCALSFCGSVRFFSANSDNLLLIGVTRIILKADQKLMLPVCE